mmetsp:Transcript_17834/g.39527  ORF Transcript_17834/g.39527 Transcript_17834/m.39527 type:complete len:311 (+) Transcript_17834:1191-2123(+)
MSARPERGAGRSSSEGGAGGHGASARPCTSNMRRALLAKSTARLRPELLRKATSVTAPPTGSTQCRRSLCMSYTYTSDPAPLPHPSTARKRASLLNTMRLTAGQSSVSTAPSPTSPASALSARDPPVFALACTCALAMARWSMLCTAHRPKPPSSPSRSTSHTSMEPLRAQCAASRVRGAAVTVSAALPLPLLFRRLPSAASASCASSSCFANSPNARACANSMPATSSPISTGGSRSFCSCSAPSLRPPLLLSRNTRRPLPLLAASTSPAADSAVQWMWSAPLSCTRSLLLQKSSRMPPACCVCLSSLE